MRLETRSGRKLKVDETVGAGGQGTVARVKGDHSSVINSTTRLPQNWRAKFGHWSIHHPTRDRQPSTLRGRQT